MLNIAALQGRLVSDPQIRQTQNGHNVASFCVACDRGRRDANGQTQADFIDVVAWDGTAEFICRNFTKGSMIAVDGRIQTRNYQDKNGNNRKAVEIVANNVSFCGPKAQNLQPYQRQEQPVPQSEYRVDEFAIADDDGDLMF